MEPDLLLQLERIHITCQNQPIETCLILKTETISVPTGTKCAQRKERELEMNQLNCLNFTSLSTFYLLLQR